MNLDRPLPWCVFAGVCGAFVGALSFVHHYDGPGFRSWDYTGRGPRIAAHLLSVDLRGRTASIVVPSRFPSPAMPMNMRFAFDDLTTWSSTEYIFQNDVLVRQAVRGEQPRELPQGSLVVIEYDPAKEGLFHASAINFARRTDI